MGLGDTTKGEACIAYKQKTCRGTCIGKEATSLHSARMMTALAKFKVKTWPYRGPVALIERDEFGMREDFHLVDRWRYLGTVHNEQSLAERLETRVEAAFDPDIYRIMNKFLQAGKLRVLPLPASL
jgi:DNA polymerase-3 subunit epsilon